MTRAGWPVVAAAVWAAGLIVAAFVAPVYESDPPGSDTLVDVNGTGVALVLAVPLLAVAVTAAALRRGHRSAAWGIVAGLAAFSLVSILSIGVFVAPVAILLAVAVART
jgi:hypothetical protein